MQVSDNNQSCCCAMTGRYSMVAKDTAPQRSLQHVASRIIGVSTTVLLLIGLSTLGSERWSIITLLSNESMLSNEPSDGIIKHNIKSAQSGEVAIMDSNGAPSTVRHRILTGREGFYTKGGKENAKKQAQHDQELLSNTKIPRKIWLAYPTDILVTREPFEVYENVMGIITPYLTRWPGAQVQILTPEKCRYFVNAVAPEFMPSYEEELNWDKRAEICKVAALFKEGGYYISPTLEMRHAYQPHTDDVTFVAIQGCMGVCFNTVFMASHPEHGLLYLTLRRILNAYKHGLDTINLVPVSLQRSYDNLPRKDQECVYFLQEVPLDTPPTVVSAAGTLTAELKRFPREPRQKGTGLCNMAIHDPSEPKILFFQSFVGSNECRHGVIPEKIWFAHSTNLLEDAQPPILHNNVRRTVEAYRALWNNPDAPAHVLNEEECRDHINRVNGELLPFYESEQRISHRVAMCRLCTLFLRGGYFFDTEFHVVEPFRPNDDSGFVGVAGCNGACFDPGLMGSTKRHPILERIIRRMTLDYQQGEDTTKVASKSIANGYYELSKISRGTTQLLEEDRLVDGETAFRFHKELEMGGRSAEAALEIGVVHYPEVPRQHGTQNCNTVVHDTKKGKVYFFTKTLGFNGCDPAEAENI